MSVFLTTGGVGYVANAAFSTTVGAPSLTGNGTFTDFHQVHGAITSPSGLVDATWTYNFAGLPLDSRSITLKARINLTTSGTSAARSGSVSLLIGASTLQGHTSILWGTSTGDVVSGDTDLFISHVNGVPLTSNALRATGVSLNLRLGSIVSGGNSACDLRVYEVWAEDPITGDIAFSFMPAV